MPHDSADWDGGKPLEIAVVQHASPKGSSAPQQGPWIRSLTKPLWTRP
jgi:hypothetical protein